MAIDRTTRKALAVGRAQANEVLRLRGKALRRRVTAARALRTRLVSQRVKPINPRLLRAVGESVTAGTLVAEGDSWFDYPFTDVLRLLEDQYAYDVESV